MNGEFKGAYNLQRYLYDDAKKKAVAGLLEAVTRDFSMCRWAVAEARFLTEELELIKRRMERYENLPKNRSDDD